MCPSAAELILFYPAVLSFLSNAYPPRYTPVLLSYFYANIYIAVLFSLEH